MNRAMQWAGAVAGFVMWFPAMAVGVAIAAMRGHQSVDGVPEAAERFADGCAIAVERHVTDWCWPSSEDAPPPKEEA